MSGFSFIQAGFTSQGGSASGGSSTPSPTVFADFASVTAGVVNGQLAYVTDNGLGGYNYMKWDTGFNGWFTVMANINDLANLPAAGMWSGAPVYVGSGPFDYECVVIDDTQAVAYYLNGAPYWVTV